MNDDDYRGQPIQGKSKKISGAIIAMIIAIIFLAAVLPLSIYGLTSISRNERIDDDEIYYPHVAMTSTEKSYGWQFEIMAISGGVPRIENLDFWMVDSDDIRYWDHEINDANPRQFSKGGSTIFAIPSGHGGGICTDESGDPVSSVVPLSDYENCSMVYIDVEDNGKITAGDQIIVYKDVDPDGIDEVSNGYEFIILYYRDQIARKDL
jgi:hypothetical protein